jgi:hypothetical protein
MTVVGCYPGNQLVERTATPAPPRLSNFDHQSAVAHGHFRGLAVTGSDFISERFGHPQREAVVPLVKCGCPCGEVIYSWSLEMERLHAEHIYLAQFDRP